MLRDIFHRHLSRPPNDQGDEDKAAQRNADTADREDVFGGHYTACSIYLIYGRRWRDGNVDGMDTGRA